MWGWDAQSRTCKVAEKSWGVPMPIESEGLRARWRTMGIAWQLLRFKYPGRTVPRTASVDVMDRYAEYMMGPAVWGITFMGTDGKPIACPALSLMSCITTSPSDLDLQIR